MEKRRTERLVVVGNGMVSHRFLELLAAREAQAPHPLQPAFEVTQITTVLGLVEAGLGVSVLPAYAWHAARPDKIVARDLVKPTISRDIVMISATGRARQPARTPCRARRAAPPRSPRS